MSTDTLAGTTAIVTGASRGFGRATVLELTGLGAHVVGVARDETALRRLGELCAGRFTPVVADATEPELAHRLIVEHRPRLLLLNAGATPRVGTLTQQTWESFSENWQVDVQHVFRFLQAALTVPLGAGSVVASMSSGAALRGSPLSGGYAGAKSTIMTISNYAAQQAERAGLDIRFVALLPQLTPATDLGDIYTRAYAESAGTSVAQLVDGMGGVLTADGAATDIAAVLTDHTYAEPAYLLLPNGLRPLPRVGAP